MVDEVVEVVEVKDRMVATVALRCIKTSLRTRKHSEIDPSLRSVILPQVAGNLPKYSCYCICYNLLSSCVNCFRNVIHLRLQIQIKTLRLGPDTASGSITVAALLSLSFQFDSTFLRQTRACYLCHILLASCG